MKMTEMDYEQMNIYFEALGKALAIAKTQNNRGENCSRALALAEEYKFFIQDYINQNCTLEEKAESYGEKVLKWQEELNRKVENNPDYTDREEPV